MEHQRQNLYQWQERSSNTNPELPNLTHWFDIVKIVHKIFVAKPWIIKDIMNIEDHQMKAKQNHIEKGTVQKYGDQTVKTIQDLITTLKAPAVRKMGQQI